MAGTDDHFQHLHATDMGLNFVSVSYLLELVQDLHASFVGLKSAVSNSWVQGRISEMGHLYVRVQVAQSRV